MLPIYLFIYSFLLSLSSLCVWLHEGLEQCLAVYFVNISGVLNEPRVLLANTGSRHITPSGPLHVPSFPKYACSLLHHFIWFFAYMLPSQRSLTPC